MNMISMQHIKQVLTAVMLLMGGMAWAQTNGQFVIKTTVSEQVHYLSHAGNALGDATQFSPNVLWTSDNKYTQGGTNRNYYFMEGNTPHFLAAPNFTAGGALDLSPSLPPGNQLSTPEAQYYFYKWDGGLGRGVQYYGDCANDSVTCVDSCGHVWGDGQCWDVYWVAYVDATWKLSGKYYDLDDVPSGGGRYYPVTITEHLNDTTTLSGGLSALTDFEMEYLDTHQVTPTIADYQYTVRPAYTTYVFDGGTHNYYDAGSGAADQGESTPASVNSSVNQVADATYAWTLSGPGATYLTIDNATSANPTITYSTQNETGHKTATLTLTVTYRDGSKQSTSANILVKTPCQNPPVQDENATVTFVGATVSWDPTATSYLVSWRVYDPDNSSSWNSHEVGDVTSYTITGLEYETKYEYKVKATSCSTAEPAGPYPTFTTLAEPGLMVTGAIFGGGRMADVGGKTEVVVVNCDSIGAIFGGNDIAGTVLDTISANHEAGFAGANITLGVDAGGTYASYGTTPNNGKVRVSSVYGGGNGYYAYNGSSFVPATSSYTSETVAVGSSVKAMTQFHQVGDVVWTNDGAAPKTLNFPRITNTAIIATNNLVKVDSIFGGAKNAFLTANSGDGDSIVINGGTVFAVFGGNNWGGGQGYGIHHIEVNGTTTSLTAITNTPTTGYGRDFGIRYLFGGGNKVAGSTTDIHIKGGQSDEVFAGGNAADVYKANVTVECSLGADEGDHLTFGDTYTNAINHESYTSGTIGENTVYTNYGWDGLSGIYNVRTLYGGNNEAEMQRVPNVTLTSGSVGTVYGGGNAGDMMGSASTTINGNTVLYGTHVVLNSNQILTDYIYGGCRMSDVLNSTWVELKKGHVGTVYGGCNISGDVGSTRFYDPYPSGQTYPQNLEEQRVKGATYVQTGDGGSDTDLIVYKDLFAGSNGYYHCSSDGIHYNEDELFGYPETLYAGMDIPTHNETNVVVTAGTTVKGNVYAGGNLAPVGFFDNTGFYRGYPELVGMATVVMTGGRVEQNVYGGGNMASIFGRNEVKVSGGTIVKGLYGGNDRAGQVAERTNRKLPTGYGYTVASDNETSLTNEGVMTFVGVSGNARIGTVYGGGNGDYTYGGEGGIPFCGDTPSHPIQPFTFVDIHLAGGSSGGKIGTVYGGGNGVTVRGGAIVFMNIVEPEPAQDYTNVDTIFGGNNKGNIEIVPDIRLLHGQVGTVYGGCNQGAMMADNTSAGNTTVSVGGYENIGSYVRLRNTYDPSNPSGTGGAVSVTAKVKNAVYGGCRMNGVNRNSLVLAEGGNFLDVPLYGGSDISGTVSGFSRVAVVDGTVGNVYGGGNGGYYYKEATNAYGTYYEVYRDDTEMVQVADSVPNAPICANSGVDVTGGQVGTTDNGNDRNIFGGGYGQMTSTTGDVLVNFNGASAEIYGDVYGGSALGSVNTLDQGYSTTVNILNGTLHGDIYGGGLGQAPEAAQGTPGDPGYTPAVPGIAATVNGKVYVNIGSYDSGTDTYSGNATFGGDVYGCNNLYGSPQDSVFVNIYQTAHTTANSYPSIPNTVVTVPDTLTWLDTINHSLDRYAIRTVYGGGNRAAYTPSLTAQNKRRSSIVHVYQCNSNTVREVFGGGNAADVGTPSVHTDTYVIIDGGRFYHVVGGGNGYSQTNNHSNPSEPNYNPGASINGAANTLVYSGLINEVYGGANILGTVDSINLVMSHSTSCTVPEVYGKVFGCANAAHYNRSVTTTIECGVGIIGELYGGSNQANIGTSGQNNADVTLNLYGGTHDKVFAGSKGIAGDPGVPANIYGNVTLNLYGGTVTNAFGGSDANGNIAGTITVNVIDKVDCHPLDVTNIYGASNLTDYNPDDVTSGVKPVSPVVNVIHIAQDPGIRGNVYGGGNQATVNANPKVNIGYHHASMAQYIPLDAQGDSLYHVPATPRAYVSGNVFGGGNQAAVTGTDTVNIRRSNSYVNNVFGGGNEAGTTNTVVNVYDGTVNTDVYGGCNTSGTVTGDIAVNLLGGTVTRDVFGGGMGNSTATQGNILVTVDGGTVTSDVYGGSALGQVNNETTDLTKVWLKSGSITGNLYGGGMGDAGHNDYGQVNGQVQVLVAGGNVNNVFGCNNTNGQPMSSVEVYINETTDNTMHINGNVYGGGNVAYYEGTPVVYIQKGTLIQTSKVFGGGNNIANNMGVGGSDVRMTGGTVLGGIYGGCNTNGDVTGNSVVTITGGTIGATGAGNGGAIFGGGYGQSTNVQGDVTVTFGDINANPSDSPKLIGDLYGGSALGNVNTNTAPEHPYTTTVNVYNGEITGPVIDPNHPNDAIYGNVYGGGLGDADHAALVNGVVYVNIGQTASPPSGSLSGKATLINCNVYGCNNVNGSPQDDVYVNVYQTSHIQGTNTVDDRDYAILQVFGGGNRAHYAPVGGENSVKKTHVYIHGCENTVRYVYGGGNAADAVGVITLVGGGHFDEIFGGGNGAYGPANIGLGGIGLNVMGGRVSYLYAGSNKHGTNYGPNYEAAPMTGFIDCGELVVETFFFGDNEAEHYGDIVHTISCDDAENYHYTRLYAGSRWAIVYGDLKLTVCGGIIETVFGGSMGYALNQIPAHVRRFPSWQEIQDDLEAHPSGADTLNRKYSYDLRKFMNYVDPDTNPSQYKTNLVGKGGNIELVITGGTIGEAIGGCDELGNVEGKITVIVDDAGDARCPLRIGNIIGASDYTYYEPCDYDYEGNQVYYDPTGSHGNSVVPTPQVEIIHVREATGVAYDFNGNGTTGASETFAGNIYGGANRGDIISNPRVTIGDGTTGNSATKVTIGGDVYGGGNLGHVTGSPQVVVVPTRHEFTFNNAPTGGTFTVSYPRGTGVSSGAAIGEGISLRLEATPTAPTNTTGYVFKEWTVTGTGASVNNKTSASTLFTMGSADASVSATFTEKPAHTLTIAGTNGTYTVDGTPYNNTPRYVVETASVTVQVTPAAGFAFDRWEVSGAGASVSSTLSATTVFTMGTVDATLTAHFKTAYQLNLVADQSTYGSFKINGVATSSIYLAKDNVATVVAIPTPAVANGNGYLFDHWTVSGGTGATLSSTTSPSVTFKMGTEATTLTATFNQVQAHELTMQAVAGGTTGTGGSFKVDGVNYTAPVWIAQGATVPIVAAPAVGYRFKRWINTNSPENGTIADLNAAYTVFTMGTGANRTIQAEFEAIATHTFNYAAYPTEGGSITVIDSDGNPVDSGSEIREYTTLNIVASQADGYHFTGWTIDDTGAAAGAQVGDAMNSVTTFTIGTANATLTATFEADTEP